MRFIGWILAELPRAVVGYDRIEEVLREPVTVTPAREGTPLPDGPLGLHVHDLRLEYEPYAPVLEGVTFEVRPGESVAIVGPDRRRQEHADPAHGAPRRPRRRATWRSAASTCARSTWRRCVRRSPWCSRRASCSPRACARTSRWTPGATDERGRCARPTIAACDRFIRALPKRLRHDRRRARSHAVGRRAPARRAGAGAGAQAPAADPGRRHQRRRPLDRGRDPGRPAARARDDAGGRRLSPLHDQPRRPGDLPAAADGWRPPARTRELLATQPGYGAIIRAYERGER